MQVSIQSVPQKNSLVAWFRYLANRQFSFLEALILTMTSVVDSHGKKLGVVEDILRISGNNQLIVKDLNKEFLVPAVANICTEISVDQKRIIVDLPEGLMDLDS